MKQTNEGMLDKVKNVWNNTVNNAGPKMSGTDAQAKKMFIDKFVGLTYSAIESALESGIITADPLPDSQPATQQSSTQQPVQNVQQTSEERKYVKLSNTFEKIIEQISQPQQVTMSDLVYKNFAQFMKGVDYRQFESQIKNLCNMVQNSFKQDHGKAALIKLGNLGYSLSLSHKGEQQSNDSDNPDDNTQRQVNVPKLTDNITKALNILYKSDPDAYKELIKKLVTPRPNQQKNTKKSRRRP